MMENQDGQRNQQSDGKSNQQSILNSPASIHANPNINVQEDAEEGKDIEEVRRETSSQRRPQFRLSERKLWMG